ncbi:MAG TPA: hypothetical protein VHO23_01790 [Candidatus Paceibacterota bacterium]|nr:hypothetical protein [Candidatus Paceibacterota bacterium]
MNIEDLTKTQLLLLTLLVNFVTSIATGVITVSLLDESAPTITQTVNRIVERTVETVAPEVPSLPDFIPAPQEPAAPQPTNEELRTAALASAAARTVEIYRSSSGRSPLGTGTYLPRARAVVMAAASGLPSEVVVAFPDGSTAEASRSRSGGGLIIFGFADTAALPDAQSPRLVASSDLAAGQTAIGIAADGAAVTGIVTKVDAEGVYANVAGIPAGGSIVSLSGDIIGFSRGEDAFVASETVTGLLSAPAQ